MTAMVLRSFVALVVTLGIAACGGDDSSITTASQKAVETSVPTEVRRESLAATAPVPASAALWTECETNPDEFLAWARGAYPEYFSGKANMYMDYSAGGVVYTRVSYAREKDNYLAVSEVEKNVFAYGNYTGYTLVNLGPMAARACDVKKAMASNKRIIVAHVKYSGTADPFPITETIARTEKIKQFYLENSYGKSIQAYEPKPWMALPKTESAYLAEDPYGGTLMRAAKDLVITRYDVSQYDIVLIIMPVLSNGLPSCGAGRESVQVNGSTRLVSMAYLPGGCNDAGLMAHEIGHLYGLTYGEYTLHTSQFGCSQTDWVPANFVDPTYSATNCGFFGLGDAWFGPYGGFDVMGGGKGSFSAPTKVRFGWIPPSQKVTIEENGVLGLSPLEVASSQVKTIEVPLGLDQAGSRVAYWLEYRKFAPIDLETGQTMFSDWASNRVKIWTELRNTPNEPIKMNGGYISTSKLFSFVQSIALPSNTELAVGEGFLDPHRGFQVIRDQDDGDNATVKVEISTLKLEPPLGAVIKSGESQTITVTNGGTTAVQNGHVMLKGRNPTSFKITSDGCGGKSLGAGRSCTIVVECASVAGVTASQFAHIEWRSDDRIRTKPTFGLQWIPAR